jgi:hypothetical protein
MKLLMGSQGKEVFSSLFDRTALGVSRKNVRRKSNGLINSIRQRSRVLAVLGDRLRI